MPSSTMKAGLRTAAAMSKRVKCPELGPACIAGARHGVLRGSVPLAIRGGVASCRWLRPPWAAAVAMRPPFAARA